MKRAIRLAVLLAMTTSLTMPAAADEGRGKGHRKDRGDRHEQRERREHRDQRAWRAGCPPGLVRQNRACLPPGQVRRYDRDHRPHRGEVLRIGDYRPVDDLARYNLERRRGWNYYRDNDRIYRVDSDTRKVLAVLELIQAFSD
ncbi:hypothetical protein SAMN04487972_10675 [Paracoccus halophilus]|uniref:Regulator RcnB of Ni and Co efflux n=1 Tax=Paracoccus halophilus TaxID=376733 RepID=A0A1I0TAX2_9RHOB|nr:hypothetical protein [Paracoccus halophilus]SFA48889.1 hypothetical protein SAMN04487972_10675 [Paracoccus halophilus]